MVAGTEGEGGGEGREAGGVEEGGLCQRGKDGEFCWMMGGGIVHCIGLGLVL